MESIKTLFSNFSQRGSQSLNKAKYNAEKLFDKYTRRTPRQAAQVAMMITGKMKQQLIEAGYEPIEIERMLPDVAHDLCDRNVAPSLYRHNRKLQRLKEAEERQQRQLAACDSASTVIQLPAASQGHSDSVCIQPAPVAGAVVAAVPSERPRPGANEAQTVTPV